MTVFSRFLGKGLAFPVAPNTATGDLASVEGEDNLKASVRMFFATRRGERVLLEDYGMPEVLFENLDAGTADTLEHAAREGLAKYEPRIHVVSVTVEVRGVVSPDDLPGVTLSCVYRVRSTGEVGTVAYPIPSEGFSG